LTRGGATCSRLVSNNIVESCGVGARRGHGVADAHARSARGACR
jgi:hypothetical protein